MWISRGDAENVVIFQYFKAQKDKVLNLLRGLPKMMAVELNIDTTKFFSYEAMERATGGTWDPVSRVYKDKDAVYAEEVLGHMVADVPGRREDTKAGVKPG